ncbi:MAG: proteasome subunit alpha [Mycobacteriaceae bacterium]|nr:proteasome subunit alpha [Mycobacteriaceae bacterium]
MTLPLYASAEQIMRDKTELARKGIARGRSVVVLTYDKGVVFVAENPSATLHKVSELYDRVGFAAVGKYNEFENLRRHGIMQADTRGYTYDRRDVTGRALANMYATLLGTIFTDQLKPYEVEVCVAEVGYPGEQKLSQLYRISFDGSIVDEKEFVVMGGTTEPIATALKDSFQANLELGAAVSIAVAALQAGANDASSGTGAAKSAAAKEKRVIESSSLEVAVLEQERDRRAFRRIAGAALETLLAKPVKSGKKAAKPDSDKPESE